jgi:hypothetical protein
MGAGGSLEIDVIGANAGGEGKLQLFCFGDPLLGQIGGQKGWEMTISASGRSFSNCEFGPSLSLVTISSWPSLCR